MIVHALMAGLMLGIPAQSDTGTTSYEIDGLRVIHRRTAVNDVIAVNLYLLGGSRQVDATTAGIEPMLLEVSDRGTATYPGLEARRAMARTGSNVVIESEPDWTLFGFRGIRQEFDSSWAVFADRITRPTLDSAAIEIVRARMLIRARSAANHPEAIAATLADSAAFANHPYLNPSAGHEKSLSAITHDALRNYARDQMVRSRMLLVVVGNLEREQVEAAVNRTLATLPRGNYSWSLPETWKAKAPGMQLRSRKIPTNYIVGYFSGPTTDSKDYIAFTVATGILSGIAGSQIRANGLSYAAGAYYFERGASGGSLSVSTIHPDTTMKIFNNAILGMTRGVFNRSDLQSYFDGYIMGYYSNNENSAAQADFLARFELLRGDYRLTARFMEETKAVSGPDIRRVAREYFKNIQYVYIGDLARAPRKEMEKY